METKKYLLDIREFMTHENREALMEEALSKVDMSRLKRTRGMRKERSRAAGVGAGLLLQQAVRDAERAAGRKIEQEEAGFLCYTVSGLLRELGQPLPLTYRYGENGKPYLKDFPYFFNLSHSGDYAVCAISDREVGVDIQIRRRVALEKLAERFFSPEETEAFLASEDREDFFFRLWVRKEAYGKLTGEGIGGSLLKNLMEGGELDRKLCWEEYEAPCGYYIAVCQHAQS